MTARVVIADLPQSVREAVEFALRDHSDLVVVGRPVSEIELLLDAREADVVLVAVHERSERMLAAVERILDANPDVGVVATDWSSGQTWMCRRSSVCEQLGEVDIAGLADVLRRAAEPYVPRDAATHSADKSWEAP